MSNKEIFLILLCTASISFFLWKFVQDRSSSVAVVEFPDSTVFKVPGNVIVERGTEREGGYHRSITFKWPYSSEKNENIQLTVRLIFAPRFLQTALKSRSKYGHLDTTGEKRFGLFLLDARAADKNEENRTRLYLTTCPDILKCDGYIRCPKNLHPDRISDEHHSKGVLCTFILMYNDRLGLRITFEKRSLYLWKEIKNSVFDRLNGFLSKQIGVSNGLTQKN
jgi:hypothetical protein